MIRGEVSYGMEIGGPGQAVRSVDIVFYPNPVPFQRSIFWSPSRKRAESEQALFEELIAAPKPLLPEVNMFTEAALASFMAALFSMMNPIGGAGVFAGMTADRSAAETKQIARTCAIAVAITLLAVTWVGPLLFKFFGVTVNSLRSAGGVIVLIIGLNMIFNKTDHRHSEAELADAEARESIAVVPLAIPMVAGPGTITTVLVAAQHYPSVLGKLEISVVIIGFAVVCGVIFSFASPVSKRLGASGMGVVTRVMGMILAAIAMGMLAEGLKALLPGLAG